MWQTKAVLLLTGAAFAALAAKILLGAALKAAYPDTCPPRLLHDADEALFLAGVALAAAGVAAGGAYWLAPRGVRPARAPRAEPPAAAAAPAVRWEDPAELHREFVRRYNRELTRALSGE